MDREKLFNRLGAMPALESDFAALTATGGRLVGSRSEAAARQWLVRRLNAIQGIRFDTFRFPFTAWASLESSLELFDAGSARNYPCHPLYWSGETPVGGLEAGLVDIGRGTEEEFRAHAAAIPGNLVIVRHEYPFSDRTIHRRVKYKRAREGAAAGFVIVNHLPGNGLVTGSCGEDSPKNIPAIGVSYETGARLSAAQNARARLRITTRRQPAIGVNLIAEVPGQTDEWVVVCAHYDGHDVAQSALDNATGVVSAMTVFENFCPLIANLRRGLRLILFTAEESGLLGSKLYVQSLTDAERNRIAVVLNLDTLAGSPRFSCLTSGFPELEGFVAETGRRAGLEFRSYPTLLRNSDHFNFAQAGIPALRLVAGFDEPEGGARLILTEADRSNLVQRDELKLGTQVAGALVWSALIWPSQICAHRPSAAQPS